MLRSHPRRWCRRRGEEVFDAEIERILKSLRFDCQILECVRQALTQSHEDERQFREASIKRLLAQSDRCQKRIEQAYLDKLDGQIDVGFFDRVSAQWREEQAVCEAQIAEFAEANAEYYDDGLRLLELARDAWSLWKRQSPAEKRKLLKFLVSNCSLLYGQLTVELNQPFEMLRETLEAERAKGAANGSISVNLEKWLPGPDSNQRPSG